MRRTIPIERHCFHAVDRVSITDDIPVDNRAFWPQVSALLDKLGVP